MSGPALALSEIVLQDKLWVIENYTEVSSTALWIIDFLQTLPMEIEAVWSRTLTGTKILFLLNRYSFALYIFGTLRIILPGAASNDGCAVLSDWTVAFRYVALVTTNALFGLRVYAICGRMKIIVLLAVALTGARVGINVWRALISTGASTDGTQFVTFSACRSTSTPGHDLELFQWSDVITGVLALTFDAFTFFVTLIRTYQHAMEMRRLGQKGITELILRDGIMYFLVVSVIQGANTALSLAIVLGSTETSLTIANIVTPFNALLPNLFVNRLVLNLRLYSQQQDSGESTSLPGIAFVQNRFLGNIGAPLDHDQWDSILDDGFEDAAGDGGAEAGGRGVYGEGWATRPNANTTLVPVIYGEENSGAIEMVGIERHLSTVAIPSSTIAIPSSILASP